MDGEIAAGAPKMLDVVEVVKPPPKVDVVGEAADDVTPKTDLSGLPVLENKPVGGDAGGDLLGSLVPKDKLPKIDGDDEVGALC